MMIKKILLFLTILLLFVQAEAAQKAKKDIINRLVSNMVVVNSGEFTMGLNDPYSSSLRPEHVVTLSEYRIGRYAVTQKEWVAVMGSNPSEVKGDNLPITNVSWYDCQKFIKRLNRHTDLRFSLPTEAQWEFAAKGGILNKGFLYPGSNNIDEVCWYTENSLEQIHEVGVLKSNELDLYDMGGNIWEWCSDWYGAYLPEPQRNPTGSTNEELKVNRGGDWSNAESCCRNYARGLESPGLAFPNIGFRLVLSTR